MVDVEEIRLDDVVNVNFREQLVGESTRVYKFLDLIFSTEYDLETQVTVGEDLGSNNINLFRCFINYQHVR